MPAALGFRVKSGRAIAVLIQGPVSAPSVLGRWIVALSDPALPESRQPYHASTGVARSPSPELDQLLASVMAYSRRSVSEALERCAAAGAPPRSAGLVVGSDIDPARIANPHVRAHAREGRLFRDALERALAGLRIATAVFLERDLLARGAADLGLAETGLKRQLTELGRSVSGGWRRDDKLAALAGWLRLG